jgi:hypothetical protein
VLRRLDELRRSEVRPQGSASAVPSPLSHRAQHQQSPLPSLPLRPCTLFSLTLTILSLHTLFTPPLFPPPLFTGTAASEHRRVLAPKLTSCEARRCGKARVPTAHTPSAHGSHPQCPWLTRSHRTHDYMRTLLPPHSPLHACTRPPLLHGVYSSPITHTVPVHSVASVHSSHITHTVPVHSVASVHSSHWMVSALSPLAQCHARFSRHTCVRCVCGAVCGHAVHASHVTYTYACAVCVLQASVRRSIPSHVVCE